MEIADAVDSDPRSSSEGEPDESWVCARFHHEIVLQLLTAGAVGPGGSGAAGMIDQVDACIDATAAHLSIGLDASVPSMGITTQQVVDPPLLQLNAGHRGVRV